MNIKNSNSREGTSMRTFTKLIAAASVLAILGGCEYNNSSITGEEARDAELRLVNRAAINAKKREELAARDRSGNTQCLVADPDIFAASAEGLADMVYVKRYRSEKPAERRRLKFGKIAEVEGVYGTNNANSSGGNSGGGSGGGVSVGESSC